MGSGSKIKFFHKVKLNDGTYTDGEQDMEKIRPYYIFDELDLKGKSILDVGCWDGYFSFEAEKKGASRVTSFDDPACRWGGVNGYVFLHNHFQSRANFVKGNVYDLANMFNTKEFDVVLCYGVLYHLSDPLYALQNLFYVCKDTIVFEGHFSSSEKPCLELIPYKFYKEDPSNVYSPSISYMDLVGRYNGFEMETVKASSAKGRFSLLFRRKSDTYTHYHQTSFSQYESK